ncbi:vesicle transport protein SFT2B-like isoform X2 [Hydractinia symbiolongicarpus]|uniref:vesicle transport protein SFT2B-like isoform X2 n=1 Tax=Hydractinia symbiolongicarpus TaxID=13093 RepID=UPI00254FD974|nr:vesicle transport protein SFT2B-like isoform X2 [Hydractinia symbiolongicarpus]
MDKIKRAFGQKEDESSIVTEINEATTLSWGTRIRCFIVCFLVGIFCSILGTIMLWRNVKLFAVLYTFGNLCALASTCFLMGPFKQLKNMFKEKRLIATIVMLLSLVLTLCAAFWWNSKPLALLFCVIQYLAMTWYCLSYIPFARDAVKKCFESCLG